MFQVVEIACAVCLVSGRRRPAGMLRSLSTASLTCSEHQQVHSIKHNPSKQHSLLVSKSICTRALIPHRKQIIGHYYNKQDIVYYNCYLFILIYYAYKWENVAISVFKNSKQDQISHIKHYLISHKKWGVKKVNVCLLIT